MQPHLRAGLLHRRRRQQPLGPGRGHGRGAPQHRRAAGHHRDGHRRGRRHHPAHPPAAHPGDHRRLPGRRRRRPPTWCPWTWSSSAWTWGPSWNPRRTTWSTCGARCCPSCGCGRSSRSRATRHPGSGWWSCSMARPAPGSWWTGSWASSRPSSSPWGASSSRSGASGGSTILGSGEVALILDVPAARPAGRRIPAHCPANHLRTCCLPITSRHAGLKRRSRS